MAELEVEVSKQLCAAFEPWLAAEVGRRVCIASVTTQQLRWDLEARCRETGEVVRQISVVTTTSEDHMRATSELWKDVVPAVEDRLAGHGVRDRILSLHGQELPKRRKERQALGNLIADRVAALPSSVQEVDLVEVAAEAWLVEDPMFVAFNEVMVRRYPIGRSSVVCASDQRLSRFEPPLSEILLPIIARKAEKHGDLALRLTLLLQLVEHEVLAETTLAEVRAALPARRDFRSVYVAKRMPPTWEFQVLRLY